MELQAGLTIANTTLVRQLGRGAQAEVWLGRDSSGVEMAVKILEGTHPAQLLRAMREARLQATVDAPNIVKIHSCDLIDNVAVIRSEFVDGMSLRQLLRRRRPKPSDIDHLAQQLFDGVEAAHAHGLIHRDLKPANILLRRVAGRWQVLITDFGIATEWSPFRRVDALAGHGELAGTIGFMAPEQHTERLAVDQRADVFALGSILYSLVTGRRAFSGSSRRRVIRRTEKGRFKPVLQRAPDVPDEWAAAIGWALQPLPRRRPQDIATLRRAWNGHLDTPPWVHLYETTDPSFPFDDDADVVDRGPLADPERLEIGISFGRQTESVLVSARLRTHRVVCLRGFPGIGKTHLALQVALAWVETDHGCAALCDLTEARSDHSLLIAVALGLRINLTGSNPVRTIGRALAGRGQTLLLLDNVEQVQEPLLRLLPELLEAAPQARFLITGRKALGYPDESVIELRPLESDAATLLFLERARQFQPDFGRGQEDRARELVEQLDGVPLAIELAAARATEVDLNSMLREIETGEDARAMRATLDWSWGLLRPWEQHTLTHCSVFRDGFTEAAAEAVIDLSSWPDAPNVVDVTDQLADHSLIEVRRDAHGAARMHLLRAVRSYAQSRMAPEEARAASEAHARHYSQLGSPLAFRQRMGPRGFEAYRELTAEVENLLGALETSVEAGLGSVAAQVGLALGEALTRIGPSSAGIEPIKRMLPLLALGEADRVALLSALAQLQCQAHQWDEARAVLEEASERARAHGDPVLEGEVLRLLGSLQHQRGEAAAGIASFEAALELLPNTQCISALTMLSSALQHVGDLTKADEAVSRAMRIADSEQAVVRRTDCELQLGSLRAQQGRYEEAAKHERKALAGARRSRDRVLEGRLLTNYGISLHQLGQVDAAIVTFRKAAEMARLTGGMGHEALARTNLGWALLDLGELDEADQALALAIELGDQSYRVVAATARVTLARLSMERGQLERARGLLEAAGEHLEGRHRSGEAALTLARAQLCATEGNREAAMTHLRRADALGPAGQTPELTKIRQRVLALLGE